MLGTFLCWIVILRLAVKGERCPSAHEEEARGIFQERSIPVSVASKKWAPDIKQFNVMFVVDGNIGNVFQVNKYILLRDICMNYIFCKVKDIRNIMVTF